MGGDDHEPPGPGQGPQHPQDLLHAAGIEWAVGSSARRTGGSWARARAMATRCCCPPESSDGRCPPRSVRPTSSSRWWGRSRAAWPRSPALHSGTATFSHAVRLGTRLKDWNTSPTVRRRYCTISASVSSASSWPSTVTSPDVGVRIPVSTESSDVLPQPLAPRSGTKDPDARSRSSPCTGRTT
jgi:hypothetical protein